MIIKIVSLFILRILNQNKQKKTNKIQYQDFFMIFLNS